MIQVLLELNDNQFESLKISGHQKTTQDLALVCNSVSILGQNFVESLLVLTPNSKYLVNSQSGLLEIKTQSRNKGDQLISDTLVKSFLIGIEKIKRTYIDEVQLNLSTSS
ncbi:MAG: ribosomal-processing cysteine protease Prp [Candidatus Cloacimonetes bacterium]|nr:ribosomal-processing cysteine protease Prp [Candidatus Cloacimonadota bacterium]